MHLWILMVMLPSYLLLGALVWWFIRQHPPWCWDAADWLAYLIWPWVAVICLLIVLNLVVNVPEPELDLPGEW